MFIKPLAFRVVLVVFGLLLGLFSVEWVMRSTLDLFDCDDELGWRFTADTRRLKVGRRGSFVQPVATNTRGFRDLEWQNQKPENVFRIAMLGDSIVAALQVPQAARFSALLEEKLNEAGRDGTRFEVLNFGVDGYGTAQELLLFGREVVPTDPDLVLLFTYPFNDLLDNVREAGSWNHYLAARCGRPYFALWSGELRELGNDGSLSAGWLDGALRRVSQLYANVVRPSHPEGARPALTPSDVYAPEGSDELRHALDLTARLIAEVSRAASEQGAAFGSVLVPDRRQAGEPWAKGAGLVPEALGRPTRQLSQRLEVAGVPHLDLLPIVQQHVEMGGSAYLEHDPHFDEEGHRVVAEAVHAWLNEYCDRLALPTGDCAGSDLARKP